jgi:glycosyltransferase involved in cell wall biosynthesis
MLKSEPHEPLFTVTTVTYNRAHLLPRAIKSVLNQTYRNFELIIVDDGSTDDTESVCRSFGDPRIKYHRHQHNKGVLGARNTALDLASGDYIASLDDDDELVPQALQTAVNKFAELSSPDVGIIWFDATDFERQQRSGWGVSKEGYISYEDLLCERIGGDHWQVVKRDLIDRDDRHDERLWCGEILWWLKLHGKCRAYYAPQVLLIMHRQHGTERISNLQTMLNHLPQLILTNKALLEQYGEEQKRLCPRAYGRRLGVLGAYQIMNGEKSEGRKACRESFRYHRWLACLAVFALSFVLSGEQIRRLVSTAFRLLDRLGALRAVLK